MSYSVHNISPQDPKTKGFLNLVRQKITAMGEYSSNPSTVLNNCLLKYILVENNGEPLALAGFYHNPLLRISDEPTCSIGSLYCINDAEAFRAIVSEAVKLAKTFLARWVLGPLDGSTWDSYRLTTGGDGPPFFLEPRFPSYYKGLFASSGMESLATYYSQKDENILPHPKATLLTSRFKEQGITLRHIDLANFGAELKKMHGFCMKVFANNFLFSPISEGAFIDRYLPLQPYIDPEFVIFAETGGGEPVGLVFAIPDHSNTTEKGLIIKTIARFPSFRYSGMTALIGESIISSAVKHGYQYLLHALMHENNVSKNVSGRFSGEFYREYKLYAKKVNA